MNKLCENEKYKKIISSPFTYLTGAVLLGLLNILHCLALKSGWSIMGAFFYLTGSSDSFAIGPNICNLGLFTGALISVFACAKFKVKKIRSAKPVVSAAIGGILMGYGARIAGGCNISAFFVAASSLSLSAWVYMIFLFAGAFIGIKLLYKFFI
jgi:uncharacterized membrane protein YedE/YeeE